MSRRATTSQEHTLERRCPRTGFMERVQFIGSLRNKPKGWRTLRNVQ